MAGSEPDRCLRNGVAAGRKHSSLTSGPVSESEPVSVGPMDESPDLRTLFHRLNNQLGIILANAELLEAKATDLTSRARATQLVTSALDAMATAREIRRQTNTSDF